jgi:hypothetical protein
MYQRAITVPLKRKRAHTSSTVHQIRLAGSDVNIEKLYLRGFMLATLHLQLPHDECCCSLARLRIEQF